MEDFVDQCGDAQLGRALGQALGQRKPFRQFKDALAVHPTEREAWFAFERQAMEAIARRWRGDHVIAPQVGRSPERAYALSRARSSRSALRCATLRS